MVNSNQVSLTAQLQHEYTKFPKYVNWIMKRSADLEPEDAQDLVQDAFVDALAHVGRNGDTPVGNPAVWMNRVLLNVRNDKTRYRHQKKRDSRKTCSLQIYDHSNFSDLSNSDYDPSNAEDYKKELADNLDLEKQMIAKDQIQKLKNILKPKKFAVIQKLLNDEPVAKWTKNTTLRQVRQMLKVKEASA